MKSGYYRSLARGLVYELTDDPEYFLNLGEQEVVRERLHPLAYAFFRRWSLPPCDWVVSCWDGRELVGFFRIVLDGKDAAAAGTWVHPEYRRRGIATKLWQLAVGHLELNEIYVTTVSPSGQALVKALGQDPLVAPYLDAPPCL